MWSQQNYENYENYVDIDIKKKPLSLPSRGPKVASLKNLAALKLLSSENSSSVYIDEFLKNPKATLNNDSHHLNDLMPVDCWTVINCLYYDEITFADFEFKMSRAKTVIPLLVKELDLNSRLHIAASLKVCCLHTLWFHKTVLASPYLRRMIFSAHDDFFIVELRRLRLAPHHQTCGKRKHFISVESADQP